MTKRRRTSLLDAIHETALGLREAGVIDRRTMKVFDEMCLTPVALRSVEPIRRIHPREET